MLGSGTPLEQLQNWSEEARVKYYWSDTHMLNGKYQTNLMVRGAPRAGASSAPSIEQAHRIAAAKFVSRIVSDARLQRLVMRHVQA